MKALLVHVFCAALLSAGVPITAQAPAPALSITLKPAAPSSTGTIDAITVHAEAAQLNVSAGQPLLALRTVDENVQTVALAIHDLKVSDTDGPIPLTIRDEPTTPEHAERRLWLATRPVHGAVTWSYLAPITNAPNPRGAAPPLELRSEDSAFSGQASTFLLLPVSLQPGPFKLRWDLSLLPAGSIAVSSLGLGDQLTPAAWSSSDIDALYFFAGHLKHYPDRPTAQGFFSAVQGTPPFDGTELLQWTERLYRYDSGFFQAKGSRFYAVLLRRNLINAGGGVELNHAFIGTFDKQTSPGDLKLTISHEMVHTFVHGLDGDEFEGSWFSEGIAEYYQRTLPFRAGLLSPVAFLHDLNLNAARYYTNPLRHTPNSQIGPQFWIETRVRVLPYDRGSFYLAALDDQLRKASGGKRSLDNLILAMLERRSQGQPVNESFWRALLQGELGQPAIDAFDAMLRGDDVLPASDAFGPCFRRTTHKLRRYDLGFDPKVLIEPTRIVRGLREDSNAARAGLRNGDHILHPVPQDAIQADQNAVLHLSVERDGKSFPIDYLPRSEEVDAFEWERIPGVPDADCALSSTI
ncbi:MAG: hypothetical protein P4L40_02860 [Terracidiphilus sp.]|nr:hypothetical protein [Terracidiphilus sp.]